MREVDNDCKKQSKRCCEEINLAMSNLLFRKKSWETCDFEKLEDGRQHEKLSCPLVVVKKKQKRKCYCDIIMGTPKRHFS